MFDTPLVPPAEDVVDCLVEDRPSGTAAPVRWSEYVPDGLLADMLAHPIDTGSQHREFESLERIGAWERVIAWAQAGQLRAIDSFMRSAEARNAALGASTSQAQDSAVAEVGLMLRVSARTAAGRVDDAWALCNRLPATLVALEQGRITLSKARILHTETANLSDEHTAEVEQQVLAKAHRQTPGQLRVATRRAVLSTDPAAVCKRAEQARRERGVQMWPEPDGMATLSAYLPAADAVGVFAVLDEHARRAGSPGDERTMDARRGDALVDLVLGPTGYCSAGTKAAQEHTNKPDQIVAAAGTGGPAGCRCQCGLCRRGGGVDVKVTIPYTALLGADDLPGDLAGYGPIPAAVARDLAAAGTWRRILTNPASGRPVDYGTTRYRPPEHLTGLVVTRDHTCQFPGCRVPAHRCDMEHAIPHDPVNGAGPTSENNLGAKCRRHHQVKQTPGWSVTQHPDGCTTWVTPSGHRYDSEPPPLTDLEPLITGPASDPDEPAPF
ncbi:MAG TPA: DUF222 domain-containing protein [Pseudonocardiaceae bacterium]